MTQSWGADAPAAQLSQRTKLEIYGAILLVLFLFALDQTVVGTALPVIVTELGGNELYVWAVTVYLLTSTISRADLGQAVRPLRPAPDPARRGRPVHQRFDRRRSQPGDVAVPALPGPPGSWRRRGLPGGPRRRRRHLHAVERGK